MKHCCSSPGTSAQLLHFKASMLITSRDAAVISEVLQGLQPYMGVIYKQAKQGWAGFLHNAITSLYCSSKSTKRTAQGTTGGCVYESVPGSLALVATLDTAASPPSPDTLF